MFSKKRAETAAPTQARSKSMGHSSNGTFSVIGADVTIIGNVTASADLHVDGVIEGDLACTSIVQGESSNVTGAIEAESARLAGSVKGSIKSRELVILKTARIDGDVSYDTLTIEQGAHVDGRLSHNSSTQSGAHGSDAALSSEEEPALTLAG